MAFKMKSQSAVKKSGFKAMGSSPMKNKAGERHPSLTPEDHYTKRHHKRKTTETSKDGRSTTTTKYRRDGSVKKEFKRSNVNEHTTTSKYKRDGTRKSFEGGIDEDRTIEGMKKNNAEATAEMTKLITKNEKRASKDKKPKKGTGGRIENLKEQISDREEALNKREFGEKNAETYDPDQYLGQRR